MNVLFVAHRYHNDGANGLCLRLENFLAHAPQGRITPHLLTVNATQTRPETEAALYRHTDHVRLEQDQLSALESLRAALALQPWAHYRRYPDFQASLIEHCRRWEIDLVVELGGFLISNIDPAAMPCPLVCDLIDSPALYLRRELDAKPWSIGKAKDEQRLRAIERFQGEQLAKARRLWVASEDDAASLQASGLQRPVSIIGNGVDADYFSLREALPQTPAIVFEGGMGYPPNVDAAQWLSREILPLIRNKVPNTHAWLVGKDPSPEVLALNDAQVTVTGTVDDVRPYVKRASVFLCPLRLGAGIKNKLLQAWAMGVPVVATSHSLGGLQAVHAEHLLVADDAAGLAQHALAILENPELAARLARAGRAHVEQHFSWQAKAAMFQQHLIESCAQ
jgi:glycosyltransferase involved in cell wall biosynthesis